ncbi:MAG: PP2C family protein-serine/threonine phosphatase [Pyrinomonadaceae bacterium]
MSKQAQISLLRTLLQRWMPRVAVAAAVLFVVRALVRDTALYRASLFGDLFGFVTFLLGTLTVCYYGFKGLRWLKRKLLWRVRRRLIITYLFVGLTPILLLGGLGFLFGYGMALNWMAGSVMTETRSMEQQTLAAARAYTTALAALPPETDARALQTWLDDRSLPLQSTLPGARVAVWRGPTEAQPFDNAAQAVSEPHDEQTRPLSPEAAPSGAPLPNWLRNAHEWSGLTYAPAADVNDPYSAAALRAVARQETGGRAVTVLVSVPVSRALVERLRETTSLHVRPTFLISLVNAENVGEGLAGEKRRRAQVDQLGEPLNSGFAFVVMPTTNWQTGVQSARLTFMFPNSFADARRQVLERGHLGQALRLDLILTVFITIFLVLELLALFAAGWMTRAVTGTVHRLYRATEFIKRGDFSHRVQVRAQDQLGELAVAYNDMAANIEALLHERVEHERLEREIEIAAEVQAQLFPRAVPALTTAEITAECRAARGVAGDYYDYIEIAPGLVALALGDVSGKGISASLVMSNLQASLRAQATILAERLRAAERAAAAAVGASSATEVEPPCGVTGVDRACAVEEITANINTQLCQSTDSNRFVTLFLAIYNDQTRALRYTNAGHNAPFLIRADGSHERLEAGGTVVGAFDFARYEEAAATLAPGDLLLIFSDGLSEAQNTTGEEYGEDRLLQLALRHRDRSADELRRAIFDEIEIWSGGQERGDDQTVVIVKA